MRTHKFSPIVLLLLLTLLLAACGGQAPAAPDAGSDASETADSADTSDTADEAGAELDPVTVQLKWVPQAQFAGYYAAKDQGFYEDEGLDVTIRPGGPDIVPEQVVASGQAEFGLNWLASLLAVRDQGTPLVNIAQVFTYAGMRHLTWADSEILTPADFAGKRIAVWFGGNEFNLLATLNKYDLDPDTDLELVQQPFDMNLLLNREVDAAAAMTYNELYQVLSAGHELDELNIIDYNAEGTAMLEDGIFTRADWLEDPANKDIAARFLRASFQGWEFCRDNPDACVDSVLANDTGGVMTREAQEWQMNEVNKLIWGDPIDAETQIGHMDPELFERTAATALEFGVIENPASEEAYTHEIWEMATGE
jgi:NitT/TauT family transport system substrate-binding protein